MGIRRVTINCSGSQAARSAAISYELLGEHAHCFDLSYSATESGSMIVSFVAEAARLSAVLAMLSERAGVGTDDTRVTIAEIMTTIPPVASDVHLPPATGEMAPWPRRTIHEIFMSVHAGCRLSFEYCALVVAAALISTIGLIQDSSVSVVASMLLSPLMAPIICITFGLATSHPALIRRGVRVEAIGVLLAFGVGALSGAVLPHWYGPRHLWGAGAP